MSIDVLQKRFKIHNFLAHFLVFVVTEAYPPQFRQIRAQSFTVFGFIQELQDVGFGSRQGSEVRQVPQKES